MKLYEIPAAIREVEAQIAEADGELTPETEAQLEKLSEQFADVAEFIALLVREANTEAEAIKAEEYRLRDRRRAVENRAERLRQYVYDQMRAMGTSKIKGQLVSLSIQKNSRPTVTWDESVNLPSQFARVTIKVDSTAVIAHWDRTGEVPDGITITTGNHLRIR